MDEVRESQRVGPRTELDSRPGYLIRRLHQIHVAMFLDECAEYRLTPMQYAVMTVLARRAELDQISIASEAGIDRTNVADVLARLEDRGIVTRRTGAKDRRTRLAALTPEGARITIEMEESALRAQDRFLAPLPAEERVRIMTLLTTLVDANNEFSRAPARKGRD